MFVYVNTPGTYIWTLIYGTGWVKRYTVRTDDLSKVPELLSHVKNIQNKWDGFLIFSMISQTHKVE